MTNVLVFAGLDPTGGAGIMADIQVGNALGVHVLPLVTALTCQNTTRALSFHPCEADIVYEQFRALTQDINAIHAIKIGMIGSVAMASTITRCIGELPYSVPVVCDPILTAGGGGSLAEVELIVGLRQMLPTVTCLTPNVAELQRLASDKDEAKAAHLLLELGCHAVLVTTTDASENKTIEHTLYQKHGSKIFQHTRLSGQFHGSGCTLASALAAKLALGEPLEDAIRQALDYTRKTLQHAFAIGKGQLIPRR